MSMAISLINVKSPILEISVILVKKDTENSEIKVFAMIA
jgi:hypothetical protein